VGQPIPFEAYRQLVDHNWFPTYVRGLVTLPSGDGEDIRLKEIIKYSAFKQHQEP
jgi:hypothetical protein